MEFRLLGPVEVWTAGRRLDAGPAQQRAILAALLVDAGHVVPAETLIERVWGDAAPESVRQSLYSHVARIRRLLREHDSVEPGGPRLVRRPEGYLLQIDDDELDLHRFRKLIDQAHTRSRDEDRLALLQEALGLWRGEPLSGLSRDWVTAVGERCHRLRTRAALDWAEAALRLGRSDLVIDTLTELVQEYPLLEPLAAELMRALYFSGRTAEALASYARVRRTLLDELGVEPCAELRTIHLALLRNDEHLLGEPTSGRDGSWPEPDPATLEPPVVGSHASPSPAQLPLDVIGFTGRRQELTLLDRALADALSHPESVVVIALMGTAGVGKTALAVHWARSVTDRFPDGQLFVDLHGFDAGRSAMDASEALRGFLDALGVPPHRVPLQMQAQSALYRSLLHGRRVLVVLDNARDAEQIRPLLPGAAGCLVVVTSRRQLTSLLAMENARPITLGLLAEDEARQLLRTRLGTRRAASVDPALTELVACCARLPLALAVVAAHAAVRPTQPLSELAGQLRDTHTRLTTLGDDEDPTDDLRAVFSWSYEQLTSDAAALFRFLGLHPGASVSTAAAASLAGVPVADARRALAELAGAHLLTEERTDRFGCHDLLRAYAMELTESKDTDVGRRAARHRLLGHELHTAHAADRFLYPQRDRIAVAALPDGSVVEEIADEEQAMAWFTGEYPALMAAVEIAHDAGFDVLAWQLAWTLTTFQDRQGRWQDLLAASGRALTCVERLGDRLRTAWIHRDLGFAHARLGQAERAHEHYARALDLFTELGERTGQARTHRDLGFVRWQQGDRAGAREHLGRALALSPTAGHPAGRAYATNMLGMYRYLHDDFQGARRELELAVLMYREIEDRVGEAVAWEALGHTHRGLRAHEEADACYRQALTLRRSLGDRYLEADALALIGDNWNDAHDSVGARRAWSQAVVILDELGHPDARRLRLRLDTR
jgi:DNA-binding SARP family transcriptional activator/Flp pilus assembly protein TadD